MESNQCKHPCQNVHEESTFQNSPQFSRIGANSSNERPQCSRHVQSRTPNISTRRTGRPHGDNVATSDVCEDINEITKQNTEANKVLSVPSEVPAERRRASQNRGKLNVCFATNIVRDCDQQQQASSSLSTQPTEEQTESDVNENLLNVFDPNCRIDQQQLGKIKKNVKKTLTTATANQLESLKPGERTGRNNQNICQETGTNRAVGGAKHNINSETRPVLEDDMDLEDLASKRRLFEAFKETPCGSRDPCRKEFKTTLNQTRSIEPEGKQLRIQQTRVNNVKSNPPKADQPSMYNGPGVQVPKATRPMSNVPTSGVRNSSVKEDGSKTCLLKGKPKIISSPGIPTYVPNNPNDNKEKIQKPLVHVMDDERPSTSRFAYAKKPLPESHKVEFNKNQAKSSLQKRNKDMAGEKKVVSTPLKSQEERNHPKPSRFEAIAKTVTEDLLPKLIQGTQLNYDEVPTCSGKVNVQPKRKVPAVHAAADESEKSFVTANGTQVGPVSSNSFLKDFSSAHEFRPQLTSSLKDFNAKASQPPCLGPIQSDSLQEEPNIGCNFKRVLIPSPEAVQEASLILRVGQEPFQVQLHNSNSEEKAASSSSSERMEEATVHENYDRFLDLILEDWRDKRGKLKRCYEELNMMKLRGVEIKNQLHMQNDKVQTLKHQKTIVCNELDGVMNTLTSLKMMCEKEMCGFRQLNSFVKNLQINLEKVAIEEEDVDMLLERKLTQLYNVKKERTCWEEKCNSARMKYEALLDLKERSKNEYDEIQTLSAHIKEQKEKFMDYLMGVTTSITHFSSKRTQLLEDLSELKIREQLLEQQILKENEELCNAEIVGTITDERKERMWGNFARYSCVLLDTCQYMLFYLLPTFPYTSALTQI